ncbi:MAG: hypothetical protein ACO2PM_12650 [Pyrobaculum sp.]
MAKTRSQTGVGSATSQAPGQLDLEKHLLVLTLLIAMWMQETLWYATRDATQLLILALEAAAASVLLRWMLNKLDPDLPALPFQHFVTVSTYSISSTFLVWLYFKHVFQLGIDLAYMLWGVLLAVLLMMPLIEPILKHRSQTRKA